MGNTATQGTPPHRKRKPKKSKKRLIRCDESSISKFTKSTAKRLEMEKRMINTTMTDDERRFLDSCLKIYREDGGVATPSGKLITNLVDEYSALGTLSPKSIARHVAEFNENLEAPIQNARRIAGAYPDLFAGTMVRPAAYGR